MKKYFLFVFILTMSFNTVFAQGIAPAKLDLSKYDENGFLLNQKVPKFPVMKVASSSLPQTSSSSKPQIPKANTEAFKQGEPASCFDYYTFGSVAVDLSTDTSKYNPGDPIMIRGQIKNNNKYPLTNLTVRARLVKNIPNPEYLRSEIITLEDFNIAENLTLNANSAFDVNYSHLLPLNAPKGEYQILFYAYNNDRFNQSGLSFTNDIKASVLKFSVEGSNPQQVYLDQTKITLNDQVHNVMAFMTNHEKDKVINISIPLVNPSKTDEDMTVTYSLYKWDGLQEKNKVAEKIEKVKVSAKGKVNLSYKLEKTDTSVYFLNITADNTNLKKDKSVYDVKTESNIRFTVSSYDYPRVNSFGVNTYPIKANQEATLFTCYHNGASQDTLNPVNVSTTLYDDKDNVIAQTEYAGKIGGDIQAIIKKFTLKKDLVNFKTITVLKDNNGKVLDTIENNYNCEDLDKTLCPAKNTTFLNNFSLGSIPWIWILLGIPALLIAIFIFRRFKVKSGMSMMLFLVVFTTFPMFMFGHKAEAASVTAPFKFEYYQSSGRWAYQDFSGSFHKEFNFIKSGLNLDNSTTSIVNIGESITASPKATVGDWFMHGASSDSPPMDGTVYKKSNNSPAGYVFHSGHTAWSVGVGIPIESGNINLNSSNSNVISCNSGVCNAVGAGTANIKVSFGTSEQVSPYARTCERFAGVDYYDTYYHCISGKHASAGGVGAFMKGYTGGGWYQIYYDYGSNGSGLGAPFTIDLNAPYWGAIFPNISQIGGVEYDNGFGTLDFAEGSPLESVGYGIVDVYTMQGFEDWYEDWDEHRYVAFSFPDITYTITVPPAANVAQLSSCAGATDISTTGATINWEYSDADSDIQTNYQVQIATDSGFTNIVQSIVVPANTDVSGVRSVAVSGLDSNAKYYTRVKTYNSVNSWSSYSSCGTGFTTTKLSVPGSCGSSNGTTVSSKPTTNLCTNGTPSDVTGTGPYNWTCDTGEPLTTPADCSANKEVVIETGACGTANGIETTTAPTTNLCAANGGDASTVTPQSGYFTWTCSPSSPNSVSASCNAPMKVPDAPINGVCGDANGKTIESIPTTDLCSVGISIGVRDVNSKYYWGCKGVSNGTNANCSATKTIIPGECGTAAQDTSSSSLAPLTLCAKGDASEVIVGTNSFTWTCKKDIEVSCSAAKYTELVAGVCGDETTPRKELPTTELCAVGTSTEAILAGDQYTWSCVIDTSTTCSAPRVTELPAVCAPNGFNICVGSTITDSCNTSVQDCASLGQSCSAGMCQSVEAGGGGGLYFVTKFTPAATIEKAIAWVWNYVAGIPQTASCTVDGVNIPNGHSKIFYRSRISQTCSGAPVTCANGKVNSTIFKYRTCITPTFNEF